MGDGLEVVELDRAGGLDRHVADRRRTRGRATDVERTHGQLGARLADRLRGHHAHGLAVVDDVATAQVAAVAVGADRSEEHTSEIQSLMRISDAVFCLKKKKKNTK